jgi:hypothetical protein
MSSEGPVDEKREAQALRTENTSVLEFYLSFLPGFCLSHLITNAILLE